MIPYIIISSFALGVALGGVSIYKIEHAQIISMEKKIEVQKVQAEIILKYEYAKVAELETKQTKLNEELDRSHESFINTTNDYHVKLVSTISQLRESTSRKSNSCSKTKSDYPKNNINDEGNTAYIPIRLLERVGDAQKRADQSAIDKNICLKFVVRDNCGIER